MTKPKGMIAIMGSGETTDSMVRVHRYLLDRLPTPIKAVFIDTPAGFQMNADDLYEKAKEFFSKRFNQSMKQASFKSSKDISSYEAGKAFQTLRQADFFFVGPGSPTYALKNWMGTPIPQIIYERIQNGGCFVAARAAALTLGRFTLPVYEIYKVGEELHWVEGLNLLGMFGLNLVVIPHWNNAEGGTHDTRFCYMGEPRLIQLEELLPPELPILGVDEHTACILDFQSGQVLVRGIGKVTLRHRQDQKFLKAGQSLSLEEFKTFAVLLTKDKPPASPPALTPPPIRESLMDKVITFRNSFEILLHEPKGPSLVDVLVALDQLIWKSCRDFEDEEAVSRAREVFRGMVVQLGIRFDEFPKDIPSVLSPLMEILLDFRERLRLAKQWEMADALRARLLGAGIVIEDTPQGPQWRLKASSREEGA